jgi:hypothetical protein
MGQYFLAVLLGEEDAHTYEIIRGFVEPWSYRHGSKLLEHAHIQSEFVKAVESLLSPDGAFFKSRLVWAGDYAEPEEGLDKNLYKLVHEQDEKQLAPKAPVQTGRYLLNHTKKQFVDKFKCRSIHPLPLLTAEGNGESGGDYHGRNDDLCGFWARDVLSVESGVPFNYRELEPKFLDVDEVPTDEENENEDEDE